MEDDARCAATTTVVVVFSKVSIGFDLVIRHWKLVEPPTPGATTYLIIEDQRPWVAGVGRSRRRGLDALELTCWDICQKRHHMEWHLFILQLSSSQKSDGDESVECAEITIRV